MGRPEGQSEDSPTDEQLVPFIGVAHDAIKFMTDMRWKIYHLHEGHGVVDDELGLLFFNRFADELKTVAAKLLRQPVPVRFHPHLWWRLWVIPASGKIAFSFRAKPAPEGVLAAVLKANGFVWNSRRRLHEYKVTQPSFPDFEPVFWSKRVASLCDEPLRRLVCSVTQNTSEFRRPREGASTHDPIEIEL